MRYVDEPKLEQDLQYKFKYLAEFMEFGKEDIAAVHGAAALLAPIVPALVDAVYVKLFSFDATKRYFVPRQDGYDGELQVDLESLSMDHDIIKFRKQHLANYLVALVTRPYDESMARFLNGVGKIHTPSAGQKSLAIPLVQMNALMGFVSDAILATIRELDIDRDTETKTLRAFNKLLWIQNDLISRHYCNSSTADHTEIESNGQNVAKQV